MPDSTALRGDAASEERVDDGAAEPPAETEVVVERGTGGVNPEVLLQAESYHPGPTRYPALPSTGTTTLPPLDPDPEEEDVFLYISPASSLSLEPSPQHALRIPPPPLPPREQGRVQYPEVAPFLQDEVVRLLWDRLLRVRGELEEHASREDR